METLQPDDPRELGSYRLLRRLGAGGMGRVYLARSPGGRTVAVKVVRPELAADADFRRRFEHEVEMARAVSGRRTAPVVDADPQAALPWLATSYVLGPDLTDVVDTHGALPEHTVRALGAGLAAALQEIHAAGLIHRDLKPSNVLLAADGPRVIDFGIARAVDGNRMTQTGVVVGSPGYMPPEQALGRDVGTPGDVFSLGAVLAFAASGRTVFGDGAVSHAAMLYQIVHGEPDLAGIPQSLLGLIRACLQKDPAQRPAPAEIVAALAPGGVDTVLTNWLPAAVSSTIATHAAGILDLEAPEGRPAPGFGPLTPPPTYGTPPSGTPGPGYGTPPPAYGTPPPGGTPAPAYGTPPPAAVYASSTPGTVQLGTRPAAPAPSRRRFLGIAAGSVAGVAAIGGGTAWWLSRDGGSGTPTAAGATGGSAEPAAETFTTPPAGTAPQALWHQKTASDSRSYDVPPQVFGDLFLVIGDNATAYDVKTGKKKWSRDDISSATDTLTVSGTTLYLPGQDYDGTVVGYDIRTGEETWRTQLGGKLNGDLQVAGVDAQRIYVIADVDSSTSTDLNAVAAVDIRTRKILWQETRDKGTWNQVQLTVAEGFLAYTHDVFEGTDTGSKAKKDLTVRSATTGKQLWNRKIAYDAVAPMVSDGVIFLGGWDLMRAVDLRTGSDQWTLSANGRRGFHQPSVLGGVVYAMDFDKGVWAVNPKTGKKLWMSDALKGSYWGESMVLRGDSLYIAAAMETGGINAIRVKDGAFRWNYNDGVTTQGTETDQWQVVQAGDRLILTHGDHLYALPAV